MTRDERDRLREIAGNATPGDWKSNVWCGDDDNQWAATSPVLKQTDDECELDPDSCAGQQAELDATYISAANPATILKLLDSLDVAEEALQDIKTYTGTSTESNMVARTALAKIRGEG